MSLKLDCRKYFGRNEFYKLHISFDLPFFFQKTRATESEMYWRLIRKKIVLFSS